MKLNQKPGGILVISHLGRQRQVNLWVYWIGNPQASERPSKKYGVWHVRKRIPRSASAHPIHMHTHLCTHLNTHMHNSISK